MNLASYIDHTILKPDATLADIEKLCREAKENNFAAVCVNPVFVKKCSELLNGTGVKVATVVGFPLGANVTDVKVFETKKAIEDGADEIDMVIAIGLLKSKQLDAVQNDLAAVVKASSGKVVKVILETCLLTPEEISQTSSMSVAAGAHFVKTSTGFSSGGATLEAVRIMKTTVGDRCKIKASGGVRTREQAIAMIEAGAERIGTSSGVTIVKG